MRAGRIVAALALVALGAVLVFGRWPADPSSALENSAPASDQFSIPIDAIEDTAAPVDPDQPALIDPAVPTATAVVGQSLAFALSDDEGLKTNITVDNAAVADITNTQDVGGMVLSAGGVAVSEGSAEITFVGPDGSRQTVTLTVLGAEAQ